MLIGALARGADQSSAGFGNSWLRVVLGRGGGLYLQISSQCGDLNLITEQWRRHSCADKDP